MIRLPISWIIGACLFGIALLASGSVFLVSYDIAKRNTVDLLYDKAQLVIDSLTRRLAVHLAPVPELMAGVKSTLLQNPEIINDPARLKLLLTAASAGTPQVSGMGFVFPDLRLFRAANWKTGKPPKWSDWSDDTGFRREVSAARDVGRGHWGEPFYAEAANETLLNYYQPVVHEGRYLGLLIAAITISDLSRFIGDLGDESQQSIQLHAFILYGRDRILAHPLLQVGYAGLNDSEPLPRLDRFTDPILANIWNDVQEAALDVARLGGVRLHQFRAFGELYTAIYEPVVGFGSEPLITGLYFRTEQGRTELKRLESIPGLVLGILVLALVLSWVIGRLVSRPAKQLATAAKSVVEFDLDAVPRIRDSKLREMSIAAEAFNNMIAGLKLFEVYVPRRLVRHLLRLGEETAARSESRELTVLFTDIAGFTKLAETLSSDEVAKFLNSHFALLGHCVEEEEGTIDKYIGDALMAFWGAPERQADAAARACRAALQISAAIERDNAERKARGESPVRMRIGIHKGPVVVGNIGFPGRINYTIVGDAVNVCQRLEALGKELYGGRDVTILLSSEVVAALDGDFELHHHGEREVKGRTRPIDVFELLD